MENHYQRLLSEIEVVQVDTNKFAVCRENKVFYVGELLFNLVKLLKEGHNPEIVQQELLINFNTNLSPEKIELIIEENIVKKILINTGVNPAEAFFSSKYIFGKTTLMSGESLHRIALLFKWLFIKPVFITLFMFTSIASGFFLKGILSTGLIFGSDLNNQSKVTYLIVTYTFILFIGMFHELGHAAATARFGIKPKEIGFGFYFVFPVLYTDVSKIWVLQKYRRMVVNLGGIYFQLIIGAILFIFYQWSGQNAPEISGYIKTVFITNSILIIYSLNPFLRNDGYWVYSDMFEIENLSKSAFSYPKKAFSYFFGNDKSTFKDGLLKISKELPLFFYCLANYVLISLLPLWVIKMTKVNYKQIEILMANNWHFVGLSYAESGIQIAKIIFFYVITTVVIVRTAKMLISTYRPN